MAVRLDCGSGDPFADAVLAFGRGLAPAPAGGFSVGGHDDRYWERQLPEQLRFLGEALTPAT